MWAAYAFGSALFAGITAILAKVGVRQMDSHLATALRTGVVLVFAWLMAWLSGPISTIYSLTGKNWFFLILSGLATGGSWLCYFRALQLGDVNLVTPVDKCSTVLTMLLAFLLLKEPLSWISVIAMLTIGLGTFWMIEKKQGQPVRIKGKRWLFYAVGSAVFASLTSILAKIGIQGVESNLATAIRTGVVLLLSWGIVLALGKQKEVAKIDGKSWGFLMLSGLSTGLSWLCYYKALQDGPVSAVAPIDKLSILLTVVFAWVFLKERLNKKAFAGLVLIVVGTLLLLL